jgi:hypothetical protein
MLVDRDAIDHCALLCAQAFIRIVRVGIQRPWGLDLIVDQASSDREGSGNGAGAV